MSSLSSALSTNARKYVNAQKPYSCHAGIRAWIKQGRRKRKKRGRETGKTEARRLMERKAAQQNKNLSEEIKQGLPMHSYWNLYIYIYNYSIMSWNIIEKTYLATWGLEPASMVSVNRQVSKHTSTKKGYLTSVDWYKWRGFKFPR